MNVIGHTIYGQQFLFFVPNYTGNVLVQFFFPTRVDQAISTFYCKNNLNINLRKRTCHC